MTNAQVRRRGAYAPLAANYYSDDDIMEAGEEAELLYVRGLAFCAAHPAADGYITDKQVVRVVAPGMPDLAERVQALVLVGLWERLPGGYNVRSWLKWNKSAEELGRFKARDRDRKARSSEDSTGGGDEKPADSGPAPAQCALDFQANSARNPDGIQTERGVDSNPDSVTGGERNRDGFQQDSVALTQHNTTQQSENPASSTAAPPTGGGSADSASDDVGFDRDLDDDADLDDGEAEEPPAQRSASYWDRVDLNNDPDFKAFWASYPRRVAKGAARKAWRSIMEKGGVEAADIIAGAEAYRDDPKRKHDITFTAHPASWLNAERWTDYDEADLVAVSNSDEWWNN